MSQFEGTFLEDHSAEMGGPGGEGGLPPAWMLDSPALVGATKGGTAAPLPPPPPDVPPPPAAAVPAAAPPVPTPVLTAAPPTVPDSSGGAAAFSTSRGAAPAPTVTPLSWEDIAATVRRTLRSVAVAMGLMIFQRWTNDPRVILALIRSVSDGDPTYERPLGTSSKLGREFYAFGLFALNEIWTPDRISQAPRLISADLAQLIPQFPAAPPWDKETARAAMTWWPRQLWLAMVLLAMYNRDVGRYVTVGSSLDPISVKANLPADRLLLKDVVRYANALAAKQKSAPELALLRAYWAASSLKGMYDRLKAEDADIVRALQLFTSTTTPVVTM